MEIVTLSMTKLTHIQILTFFQDMSTCSNTKQIKIETQDLTALTENKLCECIENLKTIQLIDATMLKNKKRMVRLRFPKICSKILISKK